jgi:small subunit ribosomal protein S21
MVQVVKREEEPFEKTMRRFGKKVKKERILTEVKRRRFYEKPGDKRKREERAARRRTMRRLKRADRRS